MLDKPMGGTELMYEELMKRLPQEYKDKFSIFNYAAYADTTKPTIYWNQLSYDQQAVQFLTASENIDAINQFVFVGNWQAEQFRKTFNIPGYKTTVLKNACIGVDQRPTGKKEKLKICYTSTPWRGLDVLLKAWEILQPQDCELHVFSSTKIYGKDFAISQEGNYQELYDRCEELPDVVYRGSIPNEELRKELHTFDILAYPNTFEETSCIAVIEALSAGVRGQEIIKMKNGELDSHLELQKQVYAPRWSWNERIQEWINYLDTLILNEPLTLEPTSETLPNNLATDIQNVGA
jgi:glycosyltransferase involved in cell wall biosynthesis